MEEPYRRRMADASSRDESMSSAAPQEIELDPALDDEAARLESYAASGLYPNVSPCPVGCKFCYERSLPELYPKLKVARIRKRSLEQFKVYSDALDRYAEAAVPAYPVIYRDGEVLYHSASDFFAQGMTLEQLDRVIEANANNGQAPHLSTMGKDFDFETARYLTDKHPDAFRVRLSVLTYNDDIKRNLIPRWRDSSEMRKITTVLRDAHIYLLHFGHAQTLEDLEAVNALANRAHKPNVGIAVVHYTRLHPPIVREYGDAGMSDFRELILDLMKRLSAPDDAANGGYANIGDLHFQHPAEAFTFRFRNILRALLAPHLLGPEDVVLCSRGAHEVLSALVVRAGARVEAVRDNLGGSTSFTTTLSTDGFRRALRELCAAGRPTKRVFVPAPVWWVDQGSRCLNGDTLDALRAEFPSVEIIPISIPDDVIESRLNLRDCYDWYNADLARTVAIRHDRELSVAIRRALGPHERLTEAGFVRRIEDALGQAAPESALRDESIASVRYDELIVERWSESYPGDDPSRRLHVSVGGSDLTLRRDRARVYPLREPWVREAFARLFIARDDVSDLEEDLRDLGEHMVGALADLETTVRAKPADARLGRSTGHACL